MARLRRARQTDSVAKTTRAPSAISDLLKAGQRITFARVSREANVSTWFVHDKPEVKAALLDAMNDQTRHGAEAAATPRSERATPAQAAALTRSRSAPNPRAGALVSPVGQD
ncbi:DUF6262 family protein [Streptomyces sp. SAS_270]|uniref:DUF6262 family protein n=1 Tax=Streptomyces sp. SAS_270 TaxID=3412748 RepID=UPI00403C54B6